MTEQRKTIQTAGVLYQIILWVLFFVTFYHAFVEEFDLEPKLRTFIACGVIFIMYIGYSTFITRILVPRLFEKKKYTKFTVLFLFTLLILSILISIFNTICNQLYSDLYAHHQGKFTFFFFFGLLFTGLGSFFYFFSNWHDLRENMISNKKEKIEAELTALKAQINPHLLFNTLNNIYSMSLEKSDKTPKAILKLSDLMSYVLYDCKKERVSLKNEIDFIESYIELEKNRFENNIKVNYELDIQNDQFEIAPLIFLPFVENAFKHSGSDAGKVPEISISLKMGADQNLIYESSNTVSEIEKDIQNPYSGIGIENISKQLAYLYPDKHKLEIKRENNLYSVYLKINLQ
ncbi:sensor histidine kinase [Bacteroidota bacterium]